MMGCKAELLGAMRILLLLRRSLQTRGSCFALAGARGLCQRPGALSHQQRKRSQLGRQEAAPPPVLMPEEKPGPSLQPYKL